MRATRNCEVLSAAGDDRRSPLQAAAERNPASAASVEKDLATSEYNLRKCLLR